MEQVGLKFIADGAGGFIAQVEAGSKAAQVFGVTTEQAGKKSTSAFDDIARGAKEKIGHIAVNALQAAGAAVLGFVQSGIQGAADFQSSMAMFETSAGATADQMAKAGEKAKALGSDLTLPSTSAADAATAMTELAKAGLSADQAIEASRGTLQLAAAGMLGNAEAATITAGALNAFGLAGGEATQVADMLAAVSNASALEVRDAAGGFKMAAAVFNSFQGPVVGAKNAMYDLTTAMGLMANAGINGSDAGTSLKQMLLQLAGPTDKAKDLMREMAAGLGLSGDLAYDAEGKMRPLKDIVNLTAQATANMTQEQRNQALVTIFGADAMRSIVVLMNKQGQGWDDMRSKITASSSASELAAVRMTGLNGAVAGLGSQVETLALEAFTPLLPVLENVVNAVSGFVAGLIPLAGPAITAVVANVVHFTEVVQSVSSVIINGFVPAVYTASAALAVYALVNLPAIIAALPILIGLMAGATAGFLAQAVAVAAAAAPLFIIAGAIAMVTLAWKNYQDQVAAVTTRVLESNEMWNRSTEVLKTYGEASDTIKTQFADQATNLEALRQKQTEQVAAYAQYVAIFGAGTEEAGRQRQAINDLGAQIVDQTGKLQTNIDTYQHLHDTDAIEDMRLIRAGFGETTVSIQLNKEEMAKWQKAYEEAAKGAQEALSNYVTQAAGLMTSLADTSKAQNDRITADQARAYADQAAAQRAHLGSMLTDYTIAWGRMNGVSEEQISKVVGEIEEQFGTASDLTGSSMLEMEGHIRDAMTNSGGSVDGLSEKLGTTTSKAVDLKQSADALEKKYVMELVENFNSGKINASEFRQELERIPKRVETEVHTNFTYTGTPTGGSTAQHRAGGGPVYSSRPYLVGERGPELFIPDRHGKILDARKTRSMSRAEGGATISDLSGYFTDLGAQAAIDFTSGFESQRGGILSEISSLSNDMADGLSDFTDHMSDVMSDGFEGAVDNWSDMLNRMLDQVGDRFQDMGGGWGLGQAAFGGNINAGRPYMVGERGPEIIFPNQPGSVVNSWDTNKLLRSLSEPRLVSPTIVQPTVVMVQPANTSNYYGQVGNNSYDHRSTTNYSSSTMDPAVGSSLYGSRG